MNQQCAEKQKMQNIKMEFANVQKTKNQLYQKYFFKITHWIMWEQKHIISAQISRKNFLYYIQAPDYLCSYYNNIPYDLNGTKYKNFSKPLMELKVCITSTFNFIHKYLQIIKMLPSNKDYILLEILWFFSSSVDYYTQLV